MNYPKILKIEITNHCNAQCSFCSNKDIPADHKKYMDVMVFEKIIKSFPEAYQIQPQWFGESLLHPEFYDIMKVCKKSKKQIVFYTNGYLIDKKIDALRLLSKKDKIIISLEGKTKDVYENIRKKLNWEKLLKNIELLKTIPCKKIIRMTDCREIHGDINNIVKFWKKKTGWKIIVVKEKPLTRQLKGYFVKNKCNRLINHFTVSVDGKIRLCCQDYGLIKTNIDLGNVYNSDLRKDWEKNFSKRHCNYDICNNCLFKFKK